MNAAQYISQMGLDFSFERFQREVSAFCNEMTLGLRTGSSLKMIPSYLQLLKHFPTNRTVIAIDMGGTNMRISKVHFGSDGTVRILGKEKFPMPGTKGALTREAFFETVAELLRPYFDRSYPVGLCFSFPCEILPNLDGRIINFNKEVCVSGAEGAVLGECLNEALRKANIPTMESITVINDTVAALLGGKAAYPSKQYSSYIGFILGTGTNSCYVERNCEIQKNPHLKDLPGSSLVNLESGGYAQVQRTSWDILFDSTTDAPNTQLLEKMISGAYIGGLFHKLLLSAMEAGCFSDRFREGMRGIDSLESYEVSELFDSEGGNNRLLNLASDPVDREALVALADAFFNRSALMVSVNLTAIMLKSCVESTPEAPFCISAEGSTFYQCKPLHERILKYMENYAHQKMNLHFEFVQAEESTIIGSALAAARQ